MRLRNTRQSFRMFRGRRAGCRSIPSGSYPPPDARSSTKQWAGRFAKRSRSGCQTNASDWNHLPVADRIGVAAAKAPHGTSLAQPGRRTDQRRKPLPPKLSSPSRTISGLNGVEATSSPYEAAIVPPGPPLKDSARSSTVRVPFRKNCSYSSKKGSPSVS